MTARATEGSSTALARRRRLLWLTLVSMASIVAKSDRISVMGCTGANSDSVPGPLACGDHAELEAYAMEQNEKSSPPPLQASRATRRGILAVPWRNGETLILWVSVNRLTGRDETERPRVGDEASTGSRTIEHGVPQADLLRLHSWKGVGRL
jgi:hypothetical protein